MRGSTRGFRPVNKQEEVVIKKKKKRECWIAGPQLWLRTVASPGM
jgi:hypothetical protein